jgi:hypothetical protein
MYGGGWRLAILTALLAPLAAPMAGAAAATEGAPGEPRIGVSVEVEGLTPTIHEWSDTVVARENPSERGLGGVALLDLSIRTEYDMTLVSYSNGESLFWISGIHLSLAYNSPEVYVAGRYPKGSCEYRAVLAHEDEHLRADREVVTAFAARVESALRSAAWPTYAHPLRVGTLQAGKEETAGRLTELIAPLLEELKDRRQEARQAVDSASSYQRAHQQCSIR